MGLVAEGGRQSLKGSARLRPRLRLPASHRNLGASFLNNSESNPRRRLEYPRNFVVSLLIPHDEDFRHARLHRAAHSDNRKRTGYARHTSTGPRFCFLPKSKTNIFLSTLNIHRRIQSHSKQQRWRRRSRETVPGGLQFTRQGRAGAWSSFSRKFALLFSMLDLTLINLIFLPSKDPAFERCRCYRRAFGFVGPLSLHDSGQWPRPANLPVLLSRKGRRDF